MAGIAEILGTDCVLNKEGNKVKIEDICKDKVAVGIYFSAHWCPPCRGFTPALAEFYKANNDKFECIFVSSDRDDASFKEYFGEMPWNALPFEERDLKNKVSEKYGVRGIPTLVILKPDGTVICENGRGDVASSGNAFPSKWEQ
ncbi:hypothetical protein ACF0H5_011867 [Mactra antiquata]